MSKAKHVSDSRRLPLLPGLLFCLLAALGTLFFVKHYMSHGPLTHAVPAPSKVSGATGGSQSVPAEDAEYLSYVMAEEKRLQERYRAQKQEYVEPASSKLDRIRYVADREARLMQEIEDIGGQIGLSESIQERLNDTRSARH